MWTSPQVEALASDASALKTGRQVADARKWTGLGQDERSLWGLCQGSGKVPYQAQVDLGQAEPAFRCTCPSRKFPCKHGLGLMLLWASNPTVLPGQTAPGWVSDWIAGRQERASRKTDPEKPPDLEAQAKRGAQREARVEEGIAYLQTWLSDLVRGGFSALPALPESHWGAAAARMVDSQASGLARMVRRIPEILARPPWQQRLIEHLGRLHLLLEGFGRIDSLSPELQAEIRGRMGWTQSQEQLLAQSGLSDRWRVVGQRFFDEEPVQVLRTWLWGETSRRHALILDFAVGGRPLPRSFPVGSALEAELVYFAAAQPQRALLKNAQFAEHCCAPEGFANFGAAALGYAQALAGNPWLEDFPLLLDETRPAASGQGLVDSAGEELPIHPSFSDFWRLASLSGGSPLSVFGEWDGHWFRPLSAINSQSIYALGGSLGG